MKPKLEKYMYYKFTENVYSTPEIEKICIL